MSGPYPLASLAGTLAPTGFTIPTYADVLASLQASFQSIFGSDAYIAPDSQDGQLLAVVAQAVSDGNQQDVALYQSFSPSYAQNAQLSSLVRINGLKRQTSSNSTAVGTVIGTAGTVVSNGVVQDANGNLWNLPASVIIGVGGTATVSVTAQASGAIYAPAGTINTVYTPQYGWTSFLSTADAAPGAAVETDAALRVRQALSVALPASTPLQSLAAAVAAVPGVTASYVYVNSTSNTDVNNVPGHAVSVIVQGGTAAAVAQAIEANKSPGTGTYGTTAQVVQDPSGISIPINFFELALTTLYVDISIQPLSGYTAAIGTAVVNAIIAFINSLGIGEELYYSSLYGAAAAVAGIQNPTFFINALTVATTPAPSGTGNIPIAFNAAASCAATNVTLIS